MSAFDVMLQAEEVLLAQLIRYEVREAEIVIRSRRGDTGWYDFRKTPVYVPLGEQAARVKVPQIHRIPHQSLLSRLFGFAPARLR